MSSQEEHSFPPPAVIPGASSPGHPTLSNIDKQKKKAYHQALFSEYRDCMISGRPIKCQDLRENIKRGELPAFPMSKVDENQMCSAWHVKGMCNPVCLQTPDHV